MLLGEGMSLPPYILNKSITINTVTEEMLSLQIDGDGRAAELSGAGHHLTD